MHEAELIDWASDEAVVRAALAPWLVFEDSRGMIWLMSDVSGSQYAAGQSWKECRESEFVQGFEARKRSGLGESDERAFRVWWELCAIPSGKGDIEAAYASWFAGVYYARQKANS